MDAGDFHPNPGDLKSIVCLHLGDWILAFFVLMTGYVIPKSLDPTTRVIISGDPAHSQPFFNHTVPTNLSCTVASILPMMIVLATNAMLMVVDPHLWTSELVYFDVHSAFLSLFEAFAMNVLTVNTLRLMTGIPLPDHFRKDTATLSQYDWMSYPNFNTSVAFVGATFTGLYLLGKSTTMSISTTGRGLMKGESYGFGKFGFFFVIAFIPLSAAFLVLAWQIRDNKGTRADVNAGMVLGFMCALTSYSLQYNSPWSGPVTDTTVARCMWKRRIHASEMEEYRGVQPEDGSDRTRFEDLPLVKMFSNFMSKGKNSSARRRDDDRNDFERPKDSSSRRAGARRDAWSDDEE